MQNTRTHKNTVDYIIHKYIKIYIHLKLKRIEKKSISERDLAIFSASELYVKRQNVARKSTALKKKIGTHSADHGRSKQKKNENMKTESVDLP